MEAMMARQRGFYLRGERVLLRPLRESDLVVSVRLWTPELRHCYGGSPTAPRANEVAMLSGKKQWLTRVRRGMEGHFFAIETAGRYIGHVSLRLDADNNGHLRIGIEDSTCWGRGYGTEAVRLMLRYAFEDLGLHRMALRVAAYNERARRCYEKCGFRVEGVERQSFQVDGEWQDDVLMGILRDEWEAVS